MEKEIVRGLSETQSSDTIIELKTVDAPENSSVDQKDGTGSSKQEIKRDQATDGTLMESSADVPDKKMRPPPLDVTSAQEGQNQAMAGPKTPTSAPPVSGLERKKLRERKIGHRRIDQTGQITFKKIQTSQIMGSIQLGIGHAIGSLASKPERDLLMLDFTIVESTSFPRDGSNITPAHHYSDFRFKSYAPVAFRYFRDLFGIKPDDYLLSLCNYPMEELTNPGASGSIFYITDDGEFIIKTVDHREAEFLQKLLPGYYMNLNENPRTLLPKYFGLYCYQCGGKNVRLVVMNNLLPTCIKLHQKYDLKGSTYKRKANKHERQKSNPTYKDLDFMEHHPEGIYLEPDTYNALIKTISRDCRVLESFHIMDYSLLVGIHNVDFAKREKLEERRREIEICEGNGKVSDSESASPIEVSQSGKDTSLVRSKSINRSRLAAFSTAMESIQAEIDVTDDEEDVPGGIPAKNAKGEHLLLFLGIIDILQSFRLKKKIEHAFKSVLHDGDTVSVHRPGFYAQRFQDFMSKTVFRKAPALKHSPSKRKGTSGKSRPSGTTESEIPRTCLPKLPSESECTHSTQDDSSTSVPTSFPSNFPGAESTTALYDTKNASRGRGKSRSNTDPPRMSSGTRSSTVAKTSVTWEKTDVSLSQVTIQTESTADCLSLCETSSSSTSGLGSTLHTVTWTPPHSVEGSTPTHTEGTPSFTESSSSGDAACPTTPVKSINKSLDSLPPLGETQILQGSEMMKRF